MKNIGDYICEIVSQSLGVHTNVLESFGGAEDLSLLGLDSIKFIGIVIALEETFDIEYPDDYLIISEANTINKLESIVSNVLNEKEKEKDKD